MKTSQWIKDVKTVIGCDVPQLFKVLVKIADEDSDRGFFARECQNKIFECIKDVKLFLGEIRRNAQDFTLHDITHCINVIDFMGQILVDVDKLNPAEISFIIYSALLHDIGMVKLPGEDISSNDLREDHGDRSARFIRERVLVNNDGIPFSFGEYDYVYMEYLPSICASHMQEFSFVEKMPERHDIKGMKVDISLCAILLRLADAMDLKSNRAPYQLYKFIVNRSISEEHWNKHMKVSDCKINENGVYQVDGICYDESAHRCLFNHLDMIESEIEKVFKWKNGPHPRLKLRSHIVERNINPQGYTMWHHTLSMDVLKITTLFMGEQLYGDKKLGLREIIQNSIDACMVRDEMNKKLGTKQDYTYKPEIHIIFDMDNNQVIFRDNGTGMNDFIIRNYFLNIGASYYSSRDFKKENLKYNPSGYFGIGFLACFMLSDDVYVRTAYWNEEIEYELHFIKSDKFVTKTEKPKTFSGTEIRLKLDQFMEVFKIDQRDDLIDFYLNEERNIDEFIYENFWNLQISNAKNNVISYSLNTKSFKEVTYQRIGNRSDYRIDLSEYLNNIEGFIFLSSNVFFNKMKYLTRIIESNPLEAIKKGEINISNNIKEVFPFIKHFYAVKNDTISEIKDDYIFDFSSLILFPTKESKIINEGIISKEKELSNNELEEYFSMYSWNCLCFNNENESQWVLRQKVCFKRYRNINHIKIDFSMKQLKDYIGYYPSFCIKLEGICASYISTVTSDNFPVLRGKYSNALYWLKQTKIDLPSNIYQILNFSYFEIINIIMKISNSLILPDSSRRFIVDSSATNLMHACSLCIYLWIYDQIKTEKEAILSTEYLKQLIIEEWDDSVEGLLRPEKKPI